MGRDVWVSWVSVVFVLGILAGLALDFRTPEELVWTVLLGLIFITGVTIGLDFDSVLRTVRRRTLWSLVMPLATVAGSLTGGLVTHLLTGFSLRYSLAIAAGMGWYSFTGTYLGNIDPYVGFLGYVSNVLREVYTYLTYPLLARRWRYSSVSVGGATTMDTTLPLITSVGGAEVGVMAFVHGMLLTVMVPVLIPAITLLSN
ncbi:MAG: lysine exporter LysO family protein [Zestosphaera sp.]